jgi:hypothetical protein
MLFGMTTTEKPRLRKARPAQPAPRIAAPRYRGVAYSVIEDSGVWRWRVLPANPGLHTYEYSVAHGFRTSREAAEEAVRAAIDIQLDS